MTSNVQTDIPEEQSLSHYDNPQRFKIPDHSSELQEMVGKPLPENATILLTHGIFSLKLEDRKSVVKQIEATKGTTDDVLNSRKQAYRLLRNFSDFGTRKVIKYALLLSHPRTDWEVFKYPDNIIIPESPRIQWDPARAIDADDFVRVTDFNEVELLPRDYYSDDKGQEGRENHREYHKIISERLSNIEEKQGWSITFDIHDTGVRMMGIDEKDDTFRPGGYPEMEIGTCEWDSCNPEILDFFVKQVEKYFGFTPVINQKYKWGYVTQTHWKNHRKEWDEAWENIKKRNVLQIELGRYLYMKESTQTVDHDQARKVGEALRMCIQKTCEHFWEEYFKPVA